MPQKLVRVENGASTNGTSVSASSSTDSFRVALSDAMRPLADPVAIQREACRVLAEHLHVDGAYYVESDDDGLNGSITSEYVRSDAASMIGEYHLPTYGIFLVDHLRSGHAIVIGDTQSFGGLDAKQREAFRLLGVGAFVSIGLVKAERLVTILVASQKTARVWSDDEVTLLQEAAERTWAAVERAHAETRLKATQKASDDWKTYLLTLSDAVRPLRDPGAIQQVAARILGEHLHASRVLYTEVEITEGVEYHVVRHGYQVPGITELTGRFRVGDYCDSPMLAESHAGRTIVVSDVDADPRIRSDERPRYAQTQVRAFVKVPLLKDRRPVAFMSVHNRSTRTWGEREIALIEETAERTWAAVERALAENALFDNQARLNLALDAGNMGTFVWFVSEDRSEADARMMALFGLKPNDSLSLAEALEKRIHPDDRERYAIGVEKAVNAGGAGILREDFRVVHPDGSVHWLAITGRTQFEGDPKRAVRLTGVCFDITARKATEQALLEREERLHEHDRRKDEFIAVLAHELRNPLAPIRTALELIRVSNETSSVLEQVRPTMERQVTHMVRLIDDLLDISRITMGKIRLQRERSLLSTLIGTAIEANREALSSGLLELSLDLPEEEVVLDVDPARVVQVLSNLLNNAAKFTDAYGQISIIVRTNGTRLDPTVTDSGAGIDEEALPRVFDLFAQGNHPSKSSRGLGVGLALARRLVEMHGGTIDAFSAGPGKGSAFSVHLAAVVGEVEALAQKDESFKMSSNQRVLVIDDNEDSADMMALYMSSMGAESKVAHDGENGLKELESFHPDVVLLDIGLPGIDGFETCRRIRQTMGNDVVVVAMTGWGQEEDKRKAKDAGFDAHLTKPVDPAKLKRVLTDAGVAV